MRTEKGKIQFFDNRTNGRYGFIRLETGEEVFFHENDGSLLSPGRNDPEFSGKVRDIDPLTGESVRLREPRVGEEVVFQRTFAKKGPKAKPWGYLDDWSRVCTIINQRAWRVMTQVMTRSGSVTEPTELMRARLVPVIAARFPRTEDERDELRSPRKFPNFTRETWFERRGDDGKWRRYPIDPRPYIGSPLWATVHR